MSKKMLLSVLEQIQYSSVKQLRVHTVQTFVRSKTVIHAKWILHISTSDLRTGVNSEEERRETFQ
jgi:hypothetical protein